ncbi:hypothetical protein TSUD_400980 [Trifolium subterraneum]|uniref:Alcohol dehydrogenase-like N-terminal domain-containing protein n=1 Tax=Trifolium subterraneum TaxID=3900 RepID=A0A2Z6NPZ1_TRISU|nr:hypothetical protein TSUD_400980 [Trifolium subterraneum]
MMYIRIVESVGEGVTHLKPRDHALPVFTGECGECPYCKSEESNMCNLLRINIDRGVMINENKSRFSIKGQPIHHFVGTSTFSEYIVVHAGCVANVNPDAPLDKVCILSCGICTDFLTEILLHTSKDIGVSYSNSQQSSNLCCKSAHELSLVHVFPHSSNPLANLHCPSKNSKRSTLLLIVFAPIRCAIVEKLLKRCWSRPSCIKCPGIVMFLFMISAMDIIVSAGSTSRSISTILSYAISLRFSSAIIVPHMSASVGSPLSLAVKPLVSLSFSQFTPSEPHDSSSSLQPLFLRATQSSNPPPKASLISHQDSIFPFRLVTSHDLFSIFATAPTFVVNVTCCKIHWHLPASLPLRSLTTLTAQVRYLNRIPN